jgi:hypothetical protein
MARGASREPGGTRIAGEELLDPALPKRPAATREEWVLGIGILPVTEIRNEQRHHARKERSDSPDPALGAADDDAPMLEVHVLPPKPRRFRDPQAVEVDQGEECAIASVRNRTEKRSDLILREVSRRVGTGD